MKKAEYCRIHTDLLNSGNVTFSQKEELISFFEDMMVELYLNYVISLSSVSTEEIESRKNADPEIVRMVTRGYLNNKMPGEPKGLLECIVALFLKVPDVKIDMGKNTDLYTQITKKVGRGDLPTRIFEQRIIYTIKVEKLNLERTTF